MHESPLPLAADPQYVEVVASRIFPSGHTQVERVLSGISTYVYRIVSHGQRYYLRILPEEGASFAPEVAALTHLRELDFNVPQVVYFEEYNQMLERSIMVETEIKGQALSKSSLSDAMFESVGREAGRELARINALPVDGFGWITADSKRSGSLRARWPTNRAFALEFREADLAYLRLHVLPPQECVELERVLAFYDSWLDVDQGYLAHGDFDTTHVFHEEGHYTGIIDFGEVRGTSRWYDLAHFRIRDGAFPLYRVFPALERGYAEVSPFPADYELHLRFTSVLINLRALSRAFQTRLPDEYIWRQLDTLREDLTVLG